MSTSISGYARSMLGWGMLLTALMALMALAWSSPAKATFAQSIRAGCYLTPANRCAIHVEPFTIPVNTGAGEKVAAFQLFINNVSGGPSAMIWSWSADSTYFYKPTGNFTPSPVVQDFFAECGQTYYLNILTRGDTSTTTGNFGNAGVTAQFTCPVPVSTSESPSGP